MLLPAVVPAIVVVTPKLIATLKAVKLLLMAKAAVSGTMTCLAMGVALKGVCLVISGYQIALHFGIMLAATKDAVLKYLSDQYINVEIYIKAILLALGRSSIVAAGAACVITITPIYAGALGLCIATTLAFNYFCGADEVQGRPGTGAGPDTGMDDKFVFLQPINTDGTPRKAPPAAAYEPAAVKSGLRAGGIEFSGVHGYAVM